MIIGTSVSPVPDVQDSAQGERRAPLIRLPWLVVFDLDGTLIDSSLDLCVSVNAALDHVGRPPLPDERITAFIGDGARALVGRALAATNAHAPNGWQGQLPTAEDHLFHQAFAYFLSFYREHKLDNTSVYPGVLESLKTLRRQRPELPMAVLTNKPVNPSREICEALALAPFFFANYGGNSFPTKKPDPEGLLQLMSEARDLWTQQGISPERFDAAGVVVIGDSPADVLTARACGARVIGCRYGLAPEALAEAGPDAMVESAAEWPSILGV